MYLAKHRPFALVYVALIGYLLTACRPAQAGVTVHLVPMQQIRSTLGHFGKSAWLPGDQLMLSYDPDPRTPKPGGNLWVMRSDGSDLHELNLPTDEQRRCFFEDPTTLSNGSVAYVRACPTVTKGVYAHASIFVWSPQTEVSQPLYEYELPDDVGAMWITFAPDLSGGMMSSYSDIEHKLYWLDSQSVSPVEVGLARASRPAWSPDGQFIAFFGSRYLEGEPGPHWATQSDALWLMPAGCRTESKDCADNLQRLLSDIYSPSKVTWSPDSRWLAFDGDLQDRGRSIWLMNINTRAVFQVADGNYAWPEWSPDGRYIMVSGPPEVGQDNVPGFRPTVLVLDVSEVIEKDIGNPP